MRITENQRKIILEVIRSVLGEKVIVILFGSRVDEKKRGGDIDLLIESQTFLENPADLKAHLLAKLKMALGDRKMDLLLSAPNLMHQPIHDVAKQTGVIL